MASMGTAIKPAGWDRSGWEAFQYMLYNPETGEILTRTPLSWLKITAFYIVYYSFLAGFWLGAMNVFLMTMPEGQPKWMLDKSIIGSNPGVGLRPVMTDKLIDSSMYQLKAADSDHIPTTEAGEGDKNIDYAVRAKLFMDLYNNTEGLKDCEKNEINKEGSTCIFDPVAVLGECANFPYGYTINKNATEIGGSKFIEPCIFLKLNKIWSWVPKPIGPAKDKTIVETLEDKKYDMMSKELKEIIVKSSDRNFVWIDCFGRYPADKEAFQVEYIPKNRGLPVKYFPYMGGNYHSPVIALKFKENKAAWGQLQHLECRTWFDGVEHQTKDKIGLKQFEVHIVDKPEFTIL